MKLIKLLIASLFAFICLQAFAIDQAAKEDTTPPAEEGPLTMDNIAPIASLPPATKTPSKDLNPVSNPPS